MKRLLALLALLALMFAFGVLAAPVALAHRSGCHRWHSCPSDSGSYTCGDLGYACRYPTYPEGGSYVPKYTYTPPSYPSYTTPTYGPRTQSTYPPTYFPPTTAASSTHEKDYTGWWIVGGVGVWIAYQLGKARRTP